MRKPVYLAGLAYELGETRQHIRSYPGVTPETLEHLTSGGLEHYHTTSRAPIELAVEASQNSMAALAIDPERIDVLLYATNSFWHPDFYDIRTISKLLKRVKLSNAYPIGSFFSHCNDLQVGLRTVRDMVAASSAEHVLVVNADKMDPSRSRLVAPNVSISSDAAASFLVTARLGQFEILHATQYFDTDLTAVDPDKQFVNYMNGVAQGVRRVAQGLWERLDRKADAFQALIPNNYNRYVNLNIGKLLGFQQDRVFTDNIARFAHANSADTIINLCDYTAMRRLGPGDLLLMLSSGPNMWSATAIACLPRRSSARGQACLTDMPDSERELPGEHYPGSWPDTLMHHVLLRGGRRSPDAVAIEDLHGAYTFGELQRKTLLFAQEMAAAGLRPGDRTLLDIAPSREAVALICACSLTGVVWIPTGPDTPDQRVQQIAEITGARLHVRAPDAERRLDTDALLVRGTVTAEQLALEGSVPPDRQTRARVIESDLAYIIFTSGTTGRPKGIMMSHRAALAFFRGLIDYCDLDAGGRVGSISPLQFDFCLLDIATALGSGCTLVFVPRMLFHQPKRLLAHLIENRITQMQGVPSIWSSLLHYCKHDLRRLECLQAVLFAGEDFPLANLRALRAALPELRLINCFGQSESIACTFADVPLPLPETATALSIGTGHPGTELLLLDEHQRPVRDASVVGELYLRAASLFSGYWRDPEATERALVPDPLDPTSGAPVFRTGDLAFRDERGQFYFCGRKDDQVQIHGNRVELGEIERHLMLHGAVAQAVVLANIKDDSHTLRAFVAIKANHAAPDPKELRAHCRWALPFYMIPSDFFVLDKLPTTPNGKLDRAALTRLAGAAASGV